MNLSMNEIFQDAIRQYATIPPECLHHAEAHLSESTLDLLKKTDKIPEGYADLPTTLLGLPVITDDTLPLGRVDMVYETEFERSVKRLRKSLANTNITVAHIPSPIVVPPPPPPPTLRALLKHWRTTVMRKFSR